MDKLLSAFSRKEFLSLAPWALSAQPLPGGWQVKNMSNGQGYSFEVETRCEKEKVMIEHNINRCLYFKGSDPFSMAWGN